MQYAEYINSERWRRRRDQYFSRHTRRCTRCGVGGNGIHLHHRTYIRMGSERDEDLVALCQECHHLVHALNKLTPAKSLSWATDQVLKLREVDLEPKRKKLKFTDVETGEMREALRRHNAKVRETQKTRTAAQQQGKKDRQEAERQRRREMLRREDLATGSRRYAHLYEQD